MKNGWYILNYHDISWEDSVYTRGVGGSLPPDVFRSQVQALSQQARLVTIADGAAQWRAATISEPLVSFWFDDGLAGVRKYALPILQRYNITAAMSINSKFMLRQELFWRFKLAYLSQTDGLRFLRSKLRQFGYKTEMIVKDFVLDYFSLDILKAIDEVYNRFSRVIDRSDALRLFDGVRGITILRDHGWDIANHSASHYPVSEDTYINHFKEEYECCEAVLADHLGLTSSYWVIPFDRSGHRAKNLSAVFNQADDSNRTLVLVGHKVNVSQSQQSNVLYRIYPPYADGPNLIKLLNSIKPA